MNSFVWTRSREGVVADYESVAATKSRRIVIGDLDLVSVQGDSDRLRQVLVNLVDNAITHSPTDSLVTVRVLMIGQTCRVEVEDRGPGVAESDRERVFDRFVRLDHSRDRKQGGAGLGLSIARAIAVAHGGTLTLHTGNSEVGTIARFELPAHAPIQKTDA